MNDRFEQAFQELRRQYLSESGDRLAELRDDLAMLETNRADALHSLRLHAHRLVGSGGSYDFPEISRAARTLEELAMRSDGETAELEAAVNRVAETFRDAAAELGDASPPQ